jgi:hypothetical protein
MGASSKPTSEVLDAYFHAWQEQSTVNLRHIFAPNVTYYIKPNKTSLRGIEEIKSYWERNAHRQMRLKVDWLVKATFPTCSARFRAEFFDIEECEQQVISGTLRVAYDENGRIRRLVEHYSKTVVNLHPNT